MTSSSAEELDSEPSLEADPATRLVEMESQPQQSCFQRRQFFERVFGRTKKSPFLWMSGANGNAIKEIRNLHQRFWNSIGKSELDADLPRERRKFDSSDWSSGDLQLLSVALAAYGSNSDESLLSSLNGDSVDASNRLGQQLLGVELAIWLSAGMPEEDAHCEVAVAAIAMQRHLADWLDTDGWMLAADIEQFGLIVASWCRCNQLFQQLGVEFNADSRQLLNAAIEQLLRLIRFDRTPAFQPQSDNQWCNAYLKSLDAACCETGTRRLAKRLLGRNSDRTLAKAKHVRVPAASSLSEWAQVGLLQTAWKRGAAKVAFAFDQQRLLIEIGGKDVLITGDCTPVISVDGLHQPMTSEIGVSCDLRFDEADLVELEMQFGPVTLQRQMLLFRKDLLLVCDNLRTDLPAAIEYQCGYPLGRNIESVGEAENREVYMKHGNRFHLALPLALPEWKQERGDGTLTCDGGKLILNQHASGCGMAAPLLLDLNPKRSLKPRTWRRLTVAESLQPVGHDMAAAWRVQIGRRQWVFYRSIAEPGNRTFLGQNVNCDFFVGRISLQGEVTPIVEVEQ